MMPKEYTKGDSITLPFEYTNDLTNYKIRCEIWDAGSVVIKKANNESGGSDAQIKISETNPKMMEVFIDKLETTDILDTASIEIEVESPAGKQYTVYEESMRFKSERINWTTP